VGGVTKGHQKKSREKCSWEFPGKKKKRLGGEKSLALVEESSGFGGSSERFNEIGLRCRKKRHTGKNLSAERGGSRGKGEKKRGEMHFGGETPKPGAKKETQKRRKRLSSQRRTKIRGGGSPEKPERIKKKKSKGGRRDFRGKSGEIQPCRGKRWNGRVGGCGGEHALSRLSPQKSCKAKEAAKGRFWWLQGKKGSKSPEKNCWNNT